MMNIETFVEKLNKLIQDGCTEISASYVGDTMNRKVLYDGCTMSGSAEQYLKMQIEQPTGYVLADFSRHPDISFRVSDTPKDEDLHVVNIKTDGKAAIIEVMGRSE